MNHSNYKKTILITGANGFIGKNLAQKLLEEKKFKILTYTKYNNPSDLSELISDSDIIFHLAGVNRTIDDRDFDLVNYRLTKSICDQVLETYNDKGKIIPIHYTSSIQSSMRNPYGISKLKAENCLKYFVNNYPFTSIVYKLPGVFGKWSRPNSNSVVATFCYNIARQIPIQIHDPNKELNLLYVDDLLNIFLKNININIKGLYDIDIQPIYNIKVKNLASQIQSFNDNRSDYKIDEVSSGFKRALYSTYLSYLPHENFTYKLKKHIDPRGEFAEILKTKSSGQFSYFTINQGQTRGGHYHHTKNEKFFILNGE